MVALKTSAEDGLIPLSPLFSPAQTALVRVHVAALSGQSALSLLSLLALRDAPPPKKTVPVPLNCVNYPDQASNRTGTQGIQT